MVIDVGIHHDECNNCTESAVATLAVWLQRDYIMMYKDAWYFLYCKIPPNEARPKIGDRIKIVPNVGSNLNYLEQYHGLKMLYEELPRKEDIIDLLFGELERGKPVIVNMDGYWCPWVPHYMKANIVHGIVVTGVDKSSESFICTDSFYHKKWMELPFDHLIRGYLDYLIYVKKDHFETDVRWEDTIKGIQKHYEETRTLESLKNFYEDVSEHFEFSREVEGAVSYETTPFYLYFDIYRRGRKKITKVIKFVGERNNVPRLSELIIELDSLCGIWDITHRVLLKTFLSNRRTEAKETVVGHIKNIVDSEDKLAAKLCRIYR